MAQYFAHIEGGSRYQETIYSIEFREGQMPNRSKSAVQPSCTGCAREAPKNEQWHPTDKNSVVVSRGHTGYTKYDLSVH